MEGESKIVNAGPGEGYEYQGDQYRCDFNTYVDSPHIRHIESTEDQSENSAEDKVLTQTNL